jgi:hypothetical protein
MAKPWRLTRYIRARIEPELRSNAGRDGRGKRRQDDQSEEAKWTRHHGQRVELSADVDARRYHMLAVAC